MKKKHFFLFFLLCFATAAFAQEFEIGGINYRITNNTRFEAEVIAKTPLYEREITIPVSVTYNSQNYSVTGIGDRAFGNCSGLTSVTIPNSVQTIGESAFADCKGLSSVTIGTGVTTIEEGAFESCSSLTSITIGSNVNTIGKLAFWNCTGLTSVTIPSSVTIIREAAFASCKALTTVTVLNPMPPYLEANVFLEVETSTCTLYVPKERETGYQTAEQWKAFGIIRATTLKEEFEIDGIRYRITNNSGLVEVIDKTPLYEGVVTIPTSVTYNSKTYSITAIGDWAFWKCSDLSSITIPNSVTSIGKSAFWECSNLTAITIPDRVTTIRSSAFSNCSGLVSITIPNSVRIIEEYAFASCNNLTSLAIDSGVESLGEGIFASCSSLTSVTIPNSVQSIGGGVFSGCRGLISVILGKNVETIGGGAFNNCSNLTTVTSLNSTPPTLGESVFYGVNTSFCTLNVPKDSKINYQTADQWRTFGTIADVTTSLLTTAVGSTKVYALSGVLYVADSVQPYTVYSVTGGQVYVGTAPSLPLPSGMYVVAIGKDRHKVVIR